MVTKADIRTLIEVEGFPAISIYLPVHPALPERQKNAIRLRNLMRQAEDYLRARGADPEAVLGEARRALDPEPPVEGRDTHGLAIFIAGGKVRTFPLSGRPADLVAVDRGFHVAPLLPFADGAAPYFAITLNQTSPELFRGTRFALEKMAEGVMERSLSEIRSLTQLPTNAGFHASGSGGRGRPAARHQAQGESAEDYQQTELDQFTHGIARAAEQRLKSETAPLVPVGQPNLLGMFRKHCRYPGLTEGAVTKSPVGLGGNDLHRLTQEVAAEALTLPENDAAARLLAAHNRGDGTIATEPALIL